MPSMGFDFIVIVPLLQSNLAYSLPLNAEHQFSVGSSVLLSMIVQEKIPILVFSQEEMSTCHFIPPY